MAPANPPGPPPAPTLGQGSFTAPVRATGPSNGQGNMSAPPAQASSQPPARGGLAQSRGGSYPQPSTRPARAPAPVPFPPAQGPFPPIGQGGPPGFGPGVMGGALPVFTNANGVNVNDESDSDSEDEDSSIIRIKIFTPINVRGDGNLIAMDTSMTANAISRGISNALQAMSYAPAQGIPMIDENGRPRPIKVTVNAPLTVLGSKNLMGERAVMERIAPGLMDRPKNAMTKMSLNLNEGADARRKRERDEAEVEEAGEKRMRRE